LFVDDETALADLAQVMLTHLDYDTDWAAMRFS
jgi:hypothetical protein